MLRRREAQGSETTAKQVKSKKRMRTNAPAVQEAQTLQQTVFGSGGLVLDQENANQDVDADAEASLSTNVSGLEPAWVDEDDAAISVDISAKARSRKLRETEDESELAGTQYASRLRNQFEKVHGKPAWAETVQDEASEPGASAAVLASSKSLLGKTDRLPQGRLECTRVLDANEAAPSQAVVQCSQFHPNAPALMTAGLDKTVRVFQVDGRDNPLLQSVYFKDLPIYSAHFVNDGTEIVVSGRRKYFYSYDIQEAKIRKIHQIQGRNEKSLENMFVSPDSKYLVFTGKDGALIMVSNKTKQWVTNLKMNGTVEAVTFTQDGTRMLSSGSDGKVYVWDLRMNKCMHIFTDEGSFKSTALAISPAGDRIVCGSDDGVVNVYDADCLMKESPKPLKTLMNLTTSINRITFHPSGQLLGITSRLKKDAFRMVHMSSLTVFSNWPTAGSPLSYVNTLDFSPRGGYASIGNDKGKVLLYRLRHYNNL